MADLTIYRTHERLHVGDHVAITDGNIDFGRWVGCPATIVDVTGDGWWVVLDSGVAGRTETRIDGKWVPTRIYVESVITLDAAQGGGEHHG